ncbi:MAG: holo-ACP synthase [Deltaproteobacteria bacterium]|nr:holo-ACP synthase [Deltaproteobacteria bacterium]
MIEHLKIGTDLVNISRFEKIPISSKPSFYKKIFLSSEIKYCSKFKNPSEHFAGKFAVKEAVKKSINKKITFLEIETYHKNSKPYVKLHGKFKNHFQFNVSISHEQNFALAVVLSFTN